MARAIPLVAVVLALTACSSGGSESATRPAQQTVALTPDRTVGECLVALQRPRSEVQRVRHRLERLRLERLRLHAGQRLG